MEITSYNPLQEASYSLYSSLAEKIQTVDSTDVSSFKDLIEMMMPMMMMQSFSSSMGSGGSSGENSFGLNINSIMAPVMLNLMEAMMSKMLSQTEENSVDAKSSVALQVDLSAAQSIHINQFEAELQVGGDGANANCGPTSLVIALRALGIDLVDESGGNAGSAVDMARRMMVADAARDGITASGARSEAEHSTWTNFGDLTRGATAMGVQAVQISPDAQSIKEAIEGGSKVIISGTFSGKYPLPWTGDRGSDNSSAPGGATGHIVAVTGYDSNLGQFIINDPARKSAFMVDAATLTRFMSGNAGALALSR